MILFVFFVSVVSAISQGNVEHFTHVLPDADPSCVSGFTFLGHDLLILRGTVASEAQPGELARVDTHTAGEVASLTIPRGLAVTTIEPHTALVFVDREPEQGQGFEVHRVAGIGAQLVIADTMSLPITTTLKAIAGAANNGTHVWVSDNTNVVHVLDARTLMTITTFRVTMDGRPVGLLTELEFVRGRLWANHGLENQIVVLNADTGVALALLSVRQFNQAPTFGCCNCGAPIARGLAYQPILDQLLLSGRYWPWMYLLRVSYMDGDQLITVGSQHGLSLEAVAPTVPADFDDKLTAAFVAQGDVQPQPAQSSKIIYLAVLGAASLAIGAVWWRRRQQQQTTTIDD
jgi:hypothetical protein